MPPGHFPSYFLARVYILKVYIDLMDSIFVEASSSTTR